MTNDYGLFCVFGVLPLLLWAAYITRYWQAQSNFYQYYPLDFLSFSNFINWLFSDTSEQENNALFQPNTVLEQRSKPTAEEVAQRSNPQSESDVSSAKKQQSVNDMAEMLGDVFIEYLKENKALSGLKAENADARSHSTNAAHNTQTSELPNNVVPLFADNANDHHSEHTADDHNADYIGERKTDNNVDDFTGEVNINGESYYLSEEETQIIKDSYRAALNAPSNSRERMYRDFIENFYGASFNEGVAKLIVRLSELRIEAKKLLVIETSYGSQYHLVDDELRRKPTPPKTTE